MESEKIMKFGYTIIYVVSVSETLKFYKEAFGFDTRFIHDSGHYGELNTGETTIAFASHSLGEINVGGNYQKTDPDKSPLGIELGFVTGDVPAAYSKALAAGAVSVHPPIKKPWGQEVAYVRSKEGSLIELCSPMAS